MRVPQVRMRVSVESSIVRGREGRGGAGPGGLVKGCVVGGRGVVGEVDWKMGIGREIDMFRNWGLATLWRRLWVVWRGPRMERRGFGSW